MAYAKQWKLTASQVQSLYNSADSQGYCYVEVYSDSSDKLVDGELWLKLSAGWADLLPVVPPVVPMPPDA